MMLNCIITKLRKPQLQLLYTSLCLGGHGKTSAGALY